LESPLNGIGRFASARQGTHPVRNAPGPRHRHDQHGWRGACPV